MADETFSGVRFDGIRSAAAAVDVSLDGPTLVVGGPTSPAQRWPLEQLRIAEHFERTPRMINCPDGATLEVPDPLGGFDAALRAQGVSPGPIVRLQRHRAAAVVALLLCVALFVYAYVDGIPAVARAVAMRVPIELEQRLGERLLADADKTLFTPTQIDAVRRTALDARFAETARAAGTNAPYRVVWRHMGKTSIANALTLPGGTIVMLDGLDRVVDDDDALVGVFGHELGHVIGRHTLRQIIQTIGVGGLANMVWGDMSSLLLNGVLVVSSLNYSRDMEREADAFAASVLKANRLSAEPLIDFLTELAADQTARNGQSAPGLLTTHPLTDERIRNLRAAMAKP
jgi:predicted Zn-dependent protease